MARINVKGVVIGGLLAGLIINIGETILNIPVLGAQLEATQSAASGDGPDANEAFVRRSGLGIGSLLRSSAGPSTKKRERLKHV